ncbi:MAG: hypothetical protein P8Y68_17410 [Anaerolineales bacterium]|jgi:hypothetical protein
MLTPKLNQLIVSGKLNLGIRAAILTLVLLSSLIGAAPAFANPDPSIVGG